MRARKIELHYKTKQRLWAQKRLAEEEGAYRVARRIHCVVLNAEGSTSGEIARLLKAPLSKVSDWLRSYERFGYEGLLEGHRCGRPPSLTRDQLAELTDIVESGPVAYGYLSGVWTSPMISRVIHEEFNRQFHPGHVRKILHRLGFSVQRPRRRLIRADAEAQSRWQRYTYPNLKKNRKPRGGANF